jgi:hypothetical protein
MACPTPLSRSRYNIVVVSVSFLLLFSAYNALQNLATSLFPPGLGNASLGVLYASAALGVFLAPPAVDAGGTRLTMLVGAACYVAYLAATIKIVPGVVLGMSVVIGLGAAVLWVALGEFIKENSDAASYGRNNGLFWAIFQLNNIVGNVGTYLVFPHLTSSQLFAGFAVVGAAGTALLAALRKPDAGGGGGGGGIGGGGAVADDGAAPVGGIMLRGLLDDDEEARYGGGGGGGGGAAPATARERAGRACAAMLATLRLLFTLDSLLLLPMYAFSGFELAFWTGEFPQLLTTSVIGLVLAFSGVGEVIGGLVFGRLSDTVGRSASIALGALLYAGGLGLTSWMRAVGGGLAGGESAGPAVAGAPLVAYAAAILFGLGDSAFNTNLYAIISQIYGKQIPAAPLTRAAALADGDAGKGDGFGDPLVTRGNADDPSDEDAAAAAAAAEAEAERPPSVLAFSVFQLAQNAGSAACFYIALQLPLHSTPATDDTSATKGTYVLVYLQAAFLAAATALFFVVDWRHRKRSNADNGSNIN